MYKLIIMCNFLIKIHFTVEIITSWYFGVNLYYVLTRRTLLGIIVFLSAERDLLKIQYNRILNSLYSNAQSEYYILCIKYHSCHKMRIFFSNGFRHNRRNMFSRLKTFCSADVQLYTDAYLMELFDSTQKNGNMIDEHIRSVKSQSLCFIVYDFRFKRGNVAFLKTTNFPGPIRCFVCDLAIKARAFVISAFRFLP